MINTMPGHGHFPGHIRAAFVEAVESNDPALLYFAAGQVWSCTDTLDGADCQMLDIPRGSSYAQAARDIRGQAGRAGIPKPSRERLAEAQETWRQLLHGWRSLTD
jgi:hypothetical protein